MVVGLDLFKSHFKDFTDQYVLIGGAACTVAMDAAGLEFRATKDLDIVLCVEALDAAFVTAFWKFIDSGGYVYKEKATGERQFYRFQKPTDAAYPFMLELFSRAPDVLMPVEGSHLTPIPMEEEISSLSAILMDENYYSFLQSGKREIDGLQVAGAEHLIPLKARAWLDLTRRQRSDGKVDSKQIKKHKNDVFRLSVIADPEHVGPVPQVVKDDLQAFLEQVKSEGVDFKSLKLGNQTLDKVVFELQKIYGLDSMTS